MYLSILVLNTSHNDAKTFLLEEEQLSMAEPKTEYPGNIINALSRPHSLVFCVCCLLHIFDKCPSFIFSKM